MTTVFIFYQGYFFRRIRIYRVFHHIERPKLPYETSLSCISDHCSQNPLLAVRRLFIAALNIHLKQAAFLMDKLNTHARLRTKRTCGSN
jgi:hypothetical protein